MVGKLFSVWEIGENVKNVYGEAEIVLPVSVCSIDWKLVMALLMSPTTTGKKVASSARVATSVLVHVTRET